MTTLAVVGDYGTDTASEANVATMVAGWSPDAVITAGDNYYPTAGGVGTGRYDLVVGKYYCGFLGGAAPGPNCSGGASAPNRFFPATGNHDYTDGGIENYLAYFSLPANERYYDTVVGSVHVFAIDSDRARLEPAEMSAQKTWLQSALAASTAPWQVVALHHPPYSSGASHGSQLEMRWPFAEWGADLVLTGHDHTYERIAADGITYLVDGLGGASRHSFGVPISGSVARYNANWGAVRIRASQSTLQGEFLSIDSGGTVQDQFAITAPLPAPNWAANNSADFDADRLTDFGLYRGRSPADSLWYAPGTAGSGDFQIFFGATSDIPVPGDYDGDGKTDAAIYRPSTGLWYGPRTGAAQIVIQMILGQPGDIPIPGDYNGDGKTDPAIFRPSSGLFFATNAAGSQVLLSTRFGAPGDVPVPRDYDGDGKTDPAIYRADATPEHYGLWYAPLSGGGVHQIYFGAPGDVPVPADYNGDKKADSVIWRPSTGLWHGPQTGAAAIVIQMFLGQNGDVPIPGYYDANLAVDPAIFRPSTGLWSSILSGGGTRSIAGTGQSGDVPLQKRPALPGGV